MKANIIKSGKFTVNGGDTIYLNNLQKLNNGDVIDPEQLVLIEVLFLGCDNYNNQHNLELKYLGNVFDLGNNDPDNPLPDFPTEHLSSTGGGSSLVE